MTQVRFEKTAISVAVADPDLARLLAGRIEDALRELPRPPRYPAVSLRTFRRLAALDVAGRIAIVRVTERGLRRLPALVQAIREKGALGVQLVWDGRTPTRARAEATVFRVLEAARATKGGPPVVLAATRVPVLALREVIAARSPK